METADAIVAIPTPARYMVRLAKHFEHRVAVERTESTALITFPDGLCNVDAGETELKLHLEAANAESLARYEQVVGRHLKQVASQEQIEVVWNRSG